MLYAIIAWDAPGCLQRRQQSRPAHLQRLDELQNEGRLITAGPMPAVDVDTPTEAGFSGSIIIAEFESLDAAKQWANADPYASAGVYREVQVHPYIGVYPK